jgi:2-keto-4-pentenoate hydratase/2-oxohepta-3-ene-1,7-dioic acid hydratase in catechol pathway
MRIVRFEEKKSPGNARMGVLSADGKSVIAADGGPSAQDLSWYDETSAAFKLLRDPKGGTLPLDAVRLLASVARPGKIMCIGLNYRDHAIESKMEIPKSPVMFAKFGTSICGPGDNVVIPLGCEKPDYEAEMAVIIGRRAKHVSKEDAMSHVLGYACFNDVSARDFQFADGQWSRGKAPDTFAPIGPYIVTRDEVPNPENLRIALRLNGRTVQDSNTSQLIFGVAELVSFLSRSMTLEPGDVMPTGTPPGVGFAHTPPLWIKPGDKMEVEIEGLGILENPVSAT